MNLPTIKMERAKARQLFGEYRAALRQRADREMEVIMRMYGQLAKGHPVVDVQEAIMSAGSTVLNLPRLAICRADFKNVWLRFDGDGENRRVQFAADEDFYRDRSRRRETVRYPVATIRPAHGKSWDHYSAAVPIIPAKYQPADKLENYHILWEAEWEKFAPVDPVLLKRIDGKLFAILAAWNLTPVERAVIGRRFTN